VYESADHAVQLLVLETEMYDAEAATSQDFEPYERHLLKGFIDTGAKHISDSHQAVGHQLAVISIDEKDGKRMQWRRLYGVDASHIIHVFSILCRGRENELAQCLKAQAEARLVLSEPIAAPPAAPRPVHWVWWTFLGVVVAGATLWVITSARASGRRRRR
jgi:hypothetical protein